MIETNLSMKDFTRYFEQKRLGKLSFPNGRCYVSTERADTTTNLFVKLHEVYKLITGWKINRTLVPLNDIVAVIAFGSTVRFPNAGFSEHIWKRRKYFLFGPEITFRHQTLKKPEDVDFYVLTGKNMTREEIIHSESITLYSNYGSAEAYTKKAGIHLINRGVNQFLKGIKADDTVSISAIKEGVPIFFNGRFNNVLTQANQLGVKRGTPRKVLWDEDNEGCLFGEIE
jgi:hypothetical protein